MKFVFFTDSHFHLFTNYAKPDNEFVNDRFKEQIEALQKVFDIAKKEEATVIFGGDLFHKRNSVDTRVYNKVFSTFAKNNEVPVLLLRGNHDATTNSLYTDSSIDTFEYLPNVNVIKSLNTILKDNVNIVFTAYGDETKEIKTYINSNYDKDMVNILVGHLGVEGSLTGKGSHRLEGAFGYQDLLPDKYDFILLGHYHRRQYFQNPNHFYGGSLMQQSFSDEQEANGVHLIDTDKMTTEFIPIHTRRFITIQGEDIPENFEQLIEEDNFIRVIGTANHAKVLEMDDSMKDKNVEVQIKKEYTVEKRIDSDVSDDPLTIASTYAKQYSPESEQEILECLKEVL
ncbi:SbcD-like subunit of palindrome specific endonuclease [Staphylococcus phage Biyabeda-mokiny_2]|nr:SbcD-like subunit of palindrome specific endonuclease [Staphylococcus phage Biyabeda-mokiny_1]UXE02587.1 SbcD-like subunit of palindrome specific endonuclease [Staphylococcus phage Biyabeda-mokiny_2]